MRELRLADNMYELRITNGYTQEFVSSYVNISRQTYSFYERGERTPNLHTVCKLAELYHVPVDFLLYVDLSCGQIAEAPASAYGSGSETSLSISLTEVETRMLTNYRALPPDDQRETREYILFKRQRRRAESRAGHS